MQNLGKLLRVLAAWVRWLYWLTLHRTYRERWILVCDRRRIKIPPLLELRQTIAGALTSLEETGLDADVRKMITKIVAVDGGRDQYYIFGLYEITFEFELLHYIPFAMQLLWVSAQKGAQKQAAMRGQGLSEGEMRRIAYDKLVTYAERTPNPDLALKTVRQFYSPSIPDR